MATACYSHCWVCDEAIRRLHPSRRLLDTWVGTCIDVCVDMYVSMCVDMCVDSCAKNACSPVRRHIRGHAYTNVPGHVGRHMCIDVHRHGYRSSPMDLCSYGLYMYGQTGPPQ